MSIATISQGRSLGYVLAAALFLFFSTDTLAITSGWQGPYVGAYVGGGFGNDHVSTNTGTVTSTSYFPTAADINAVNDTGTATSHPNSVMAGVQAGHDWVWQQLVYGIVFDYSALPLSLSNTVNNVTYPDNSDTYSIYTSMRTNWLFTLRGRLGYQVRWYWPSLFYLTGGMAITQLRVNNNFSDSSFYAGAGGNSTSENAIGWTAGLGIELASFKHMSMDLEYLYITVPSVKTTSSISNTEGGFGIPPQSLTSVFTTTGQFHTNLLTVGLHYRFDE